MRTVTFADLNVVDRVQQDFIPVWHNQAPDFYSVRGRQQVSTPQQVRAYPEGGGGGNVRTYFCAADGTVLYYLEGYWGAQRYRAEMKFATDLATRLARLPAGQRVASARAALAARRQRVADERRTLREKYPEEFKKKVGDSEVRRRETALGLLDNTLKASTPLVGHSVAPILEEIRSQNRAIMAAT